MTTPQASGTHNIVATFSGTTGFAPSTSATLAQALTAACPGGTKANFRWHYTANGNAGGWSGTATHTCPGSFTMGPQAMDGNLRVAPGATLQAGYDFALPGNHNSLTMTVLAAKVTFAVACLSGAAPVGQHADRDHASPDLPDHQRPVVPQRRPVQPAGLPGVGHRAGLCGGGTISLAKGGTFTATLG
jgi:hypothetical protein